MRSWRGICCRTSPTETVMPMSRSTSRAKRASTFAGNHAVNALGAAGIQKRLVDRKRLDQRRQRLHGMAHLAADPDILRHVGPDHGRGRAQRQRLEHRHWRSAHRRCARCSRPPRPRRACPPPMMTGLSASSGLSRFSTVAENASQSMWARVSEGQRMVTNEPGRAAFAASPGTRGPDHQRQSRQKQVGPPDSSAVRVHGTSGSEGSSSSTSRAAAMVVGVEFRGGRECRPRSRHRAR